MTKKPKAIPARVVAIMDRIYGARSSTPQAKHALPSEPRPEKRMAWLTLAGQYTFELPKRFHPPKPGPAWFRTSGPEEVLELYAELRRAVIKKWPRMREWTGDTWARWMLPDGRQMTVEFAAKKKRQSDAASAT